MTDERGWQKAAVIVAAFALVAIGAAARGDLWLVEIWSIDFARSAASAIDLFAIHHDNNHVLNTLYLYLVRGLRATFVFRLLAVTCGFASVIAAGFAALEWGRAEAVWTMAVTGLSYPLVLYFSEARGYAPAIFFALVAFIILRRSRGRNDLLPAIAFWVACALGVLAHLTFVAIVIAFAAGSLTWRSVSRMFVWHAPPLVMSIGWVSYFSRDFVFGRGPVYSWRMVLDRGAAVLLGLPDGAQSIAFAVYVVIVGAGTYVLWRRSDEMWIFGPVVCLLAPALLLVVAQPRYLYFRYFVVTFPFFYLLAVKLAMEMRQRPVAVAIALLFFAGQLVRVTTLVRVGRGHYRAALHRMVQDTTTERISVGSDDDVANGTVLRFYAADLPPSRVLRYIPIGEWATEPPEWFIYHTQDVNAAAPPGLTLRGAGSYRFVQRFPFEGTSGMEWFLFRRGNR